MTMAYAYSSAAFYTGGVSDTKSSLPSSVQRERLITDACVTEHLDIYNFIPLDSITDDSKFMMAARINANKAQAALLTNASGIATFAVHGPLITPEIEKISSSSSDSERYCH